MNVTQKLMLAAVMTSIAGVATAQADVISGVTSATTIGEGGGNTITHLNPNWNTGFTKISSGAEVYTRFTSSTTILGMQGVQVLNFESNNGFGSVLSGQTLGSGSNGSVFTTAGSISPYSAANAITGITLINGYSISTAVNTYNGTTKKLEAAAAGSGVFLVGDDPAGRVMVSGNQALIAGPAANNSGMTFSFATNISAFSLVVNCANDSASSPTYLIVAFDTDGNALASYRQGVSNNAAMNIGFSTSAANIRSVWVGQVTTSNTAIVIDDVAFVPVPEPATAGIVLGGGLGALALLRKK